MKIGSDYATGSIEFGIRIEDLDKENPPVYVLFENEASTEWKLFSGTLSGFLMYILCAALCCESYSTARKILKEEGWTYENARNRKMSLTYTLLLMAYLYAVDLTRIPAYCCRFCQIGRAGLTVFQKVDQ